MLSKCAAVPGFLIVCLLLAPDPPAWGVPANQRVWTFAQPEGTTFQARLRGDEFYSYHQTLDGALILQDRDTGVWYYAEPKADGSLQKTAIPVGQGRIAIAALDTERPQWRDAVREIMAQRAMNARSEVRPAQALSTKGNVKGVLLLANFSDASTTFTRSVFNDLMNTAGYQSNGALGSVKDYYREVSYGQLTLQIDVYDWIRLRQTHAYYGQDDPNTKGPQDLNVRQMIEETIKAADPQVNFADYDGDGDGCVDLLGVVHQGQGQEQMGDNSRDRIFSQSGSLDPPVEVDGVRIQGYYTVPEKYYEKLVTLGAFCHEIGHRFRLPDLYDVDYSSEGVGNWSIMGGGSWLGPNNNGAKPCHFDPWCKSVLGWLTPTVISAAASGVALPAFDTHPTALLIPADPYQDGEYFLVANRYARVGASAATGFDQYLPGSGALILHVDEYIPDNTTETRKLVAVEEADGKQDLDNNANSGDRGDLYPLGGSVFTDTSTPNSRDNQGAGTGIALRNFVGAGTDLMKCDVTPSPYLKGYTISYDGWGNRLNRRGAGRTDGRLCVRFQIDQKGILERVEAYFWQKGVTDYTVNVYRGWGNNGPTGPLTTQSGSHTGRGYEEIVLTTPQSFEPGPPGGGAEFVVEIQYDTKGAFEFPLPLVDDGDCSGRTYLRTNAGTYTQFAASGDEPYDAPIRANLRLPGLTPPEPPVDGGEIVLTFENLVTKEAGQIPDQYGGLTWSDSFWVFKPSLDSPSGYKNGMISPPYVAYNNHGNPVEVSGEPFTLVGAHLTAAWRDDLRIEVNGYRAGFRLYNRVITVSADSPKWVRLNYEAVDRVTFNSFGGTQSQKLPSDGNHFIMDDMTIQR